MNKHQLRNALAGYGIPVLAETSEDSMTLMLSVMRRDVAADIVDIQMAHEMDFYHSSANRQGPLCGAIHVPFDMIVTPESGVVSCPHCLSIMESQTWGYWYTRYAEQDYNG